jgi:hypothetical protein
MNVKLKFLFGYVLLSLVSIPVFAQVQYNKSFSGIDKEKQLFIFKSLLGILVFN